MLEVSMRRLARRMHYHRYPVKPTWGHIAEMRLHLDGDPIFDSMTNKNRAKLFYGIWRTRRQNELFDSLAHLHAAPQRVGDRKRLQSTLRKTLREIGKNRNSDFPRAVEASGEREGILFEDAVAEVIAAGKVLRRLLEASETLPPLPPLNTSITRIDGEAQNIRALLRRLDILVGATDGYGGPGARMMRRILAYTSKAPTFDALKQRNLKARQPRR
jgi:hypothetical protein